MILVLTDRFLYIELKTSRATFGSVRFDKIKTKVEHVDTNIKQLRNRVDAFKACVKNGAAYIEEIVLVGVSMAVKDIEEYKRVLENMKVMAACFRSG